MTFGKVMGGGLPAAAFGGRADVMAQLAPEGPRLPGGHPVRQPAGLRRRPGHPARLRRGGLRPGRPPRRWSSAAPSPTRWPPTGVPHRLQRAGNLFSIFFTEEQVVDFAGAQTQNTAAYAAFFHAMLEQGVYLPPSAYEAWFLSAAHDDEALSRIADALPLAAKAAAQAS